MRQTRQDQKQSQFSETAVADGGGKSELLSDLFQDEEQAEDGALEQFLKGKSIQFPAKEPAEDLQARRGPRGEVGDGAFFDLGAFSEGLAEEDGGGRVTVGDDIDEHGHKYTQILVGVKQVLHYMDTQGRTRNPLKLASSMVRTETQLVNGGKIRLTNTESNARVERKGKALLRTDDWQT